MTKPRIELSFRYLTAPQVRKELGLSRFQLDLRINRQLLPAPTYIDPKTQIRYFDQDWLDAAKLIISRINNRQPKERVIAER